MGEPGAPYVAATTVDEMTALIVSARGEPKISAIKPEATRPVPLTASAYAGRERVDATNAVNIPVSIKKSKLISGGTVKGAGGLMTGVSCPEGRRPNAEMNTVIKINQPLRYKQVCKFSDFCNVD